MSENKFAAMFRRAAYWAEQDSNYDEVPDWHAAVEHLERCEKLLARYYASHNDPKFGPCDCDACSECRKARVE